MKIDSKYFGVFVLLIAILCVFAITWGTLSYRENQLEGFNSKLATYDSLLTHPFLNFETSDSLQLKQLKGKPVVLVFWSTWSGKSQELRFALEDAQDKLNFYLVAGSVKDVREDVFKALHAKADDRYFVDAQLLYDRLKIPGIPSLMLLGSEGEVLWTKVGYKGEAIADSLAYYISQ